MMELILIRHGETNYNVQKIIQGQIDEPLNNNGKDQAKKIAARLKNKKIDIAYVSNLGRAVETGKAILSFHPRTKIVYTEELRERSFGVIEGMTRPEYVRIREQSGYSFADFKPKGGESIRETQQRASNFYQKIVSKHDQQRVLVVSHGGLITSLLISLVNQSLDFEQYRKFHLGNTGMTVLEVGQDGIKIKLLNCAEHLTS